MKDENIVLNDLKIHSSQCSWDWEADLRFAKAINSELVNDLKSIINSKAPIPFLVMNHRIIIKQKITDRRIRALRKLIKRGIVQANWIGTGEFGKTDFGVNRNRDYSLVKNLYSNTTY